MAFLAIVIAIACGGDPPDREIQQAQEAIDVARTAGADQYAREEFMAAVDALKHANEAVAQRDYRRALNNALDSREQALNAAKLAAKGKASARLEAERSLAAATMALNGAQSRVKAAEAAHARGRGVAGARRAVTDAGKHLQEARAAYEQGDYVKAKTMASSVSSALGFAIRDLDAPRAPASRPHL